MKLVIKQQPVRRILRWSRYFLLAVASSMLAYSGFVVVDAWVFQKAERIEFERQLIIATTGSKPLPPDVNVIGRIEIPRLDISVMVMEGTSESTLRRAVGHISGTALPGRPGNIGISGHRDTFFRPLRNIRRDDRITLTTLQGEYSYRVVSTKVVDPHDIGVLDASAEEILTLTTCFPFYFVGSAPDRFIVVAERVI